MPSSDRWDARPEFSATRTTAPFYLPEKATIPPVTAAIHAGHEPRPEVEDLLAIDESSRLREEDPFTDRTATCVDARVAEHRSRFEVDLNRGRDAAVYCSPEDAWSLDLWQGRLTESVLRRSLVIYDPFYEGLGRFLDRVAASGPFVVFDMHSYNHRRQGPDGPEAPPSGGSARAARGLGSGVRSVVR